MCLIKHAMYIIDDLIKEYNVHYDVENKYYSTYSYMKEYISKNDIVLKDNLSRDRVEQFIYSLDVPYLKQNIYRILNPEKEITDEIFTTDIQKCKLSDLSDGQLLKYMLDILFTITYNQNGNLVLLKYNVAIWNTGFHKLAKLCRGKIVDTEDDYKIVSYPFDKFFNLNENEDTDEKLIEKYISGADYIYVNDKIDGSTIIVSNYKGKPLITTNGSFDNIQIDWANEMFQKKYKTFFKEMKDGYTYIFELVHPENRIVLDYGESECLYLLNIRDISSGRLLPLSDVHFIAKRHGFALPEVYDFKNLKDMIKLAHELTDVNKEGWVFRIGYKGNEYMVKLKLDEYFAMHRAFGKVTINWVYKQMLSEVIDDTLSICNDEQKKEIFKLIDEVNQCRKKIIEQVEVEARAILEKYDLTVETFEDNKELMVKIIKEILSSDSLVKHFVLKYVKGYKDISHNINKITYKKFMQFYALMKTE